jgi:hypothetical protein
MDGLTPASADDLPHLGELVADEPFWRYQAGGPGREEVAHLRVWLTTGPEPGHLAVVTETGLAASVTESARHIRAELARRYGPAVVLLDYHLAPEFAEGADTLDLVRFGADGSPHWSRIWPTPEEHPPSRRPGAMDGRPWLPDRQPARGMVRLWPGRGELTVRSCRPPDPGAGVAGLHGVRSRDVRPRPAVGSGVGRYVADAEFTGQLPVRQAVRPPRS